MAGKTKVQRQAAARSAHRHLLTAQSLTRKAMGLLYTAGHYDAILDLQKGMNWLGLAARRATVQPKKRK